MHNIRRMAKISERRRRALEHHKHEYENVHDYVSPAVALLPEGEDQVG